MKLYKKISILNDIDDRLLFPRLYEIREFPYHRLIIEKITDTFDNKRVSIEDYRVISIRILTALRVIHNMKYIHRDLAPDNIGYRDEIKQAILFDFGCIVEIRPLMRHLYVTRREYSSINAYKNTDSFVRPFDDIESWFYVSMTLLGIPMPWMDLADKWEKLSDRLSELESSDLRSSSIKENQTDESNKNSTSRYEELDQIECQISDLKIQIIDTKLNYLKESNTNTDLPLYLKYYADLLYQHITTDILVPGENVWSLNLNHQSYIDIFMNVGPAIGCL